MRANITILALEKTFLIMRKKCNCFHSIPASSVSVENLEIHKISIVIL